MDMDTEYIKFTPPLPCTTKSCKKLATGGTLQKEKKETQWVLTPLCESCVIELTEMYSSQSSA